MIKREVRKDCFAFVSNNENGCFALTKLNCKDCSFYKHSDNPKQTRDQIEKEIDFYHRTKP